MEGEESLALVDGGLQGHFHILVILCTLCEAQKGLFLAKGVDKMSSSSPVAFLSSTWDVFHIFADSAHEMTLP